MKVLLVDDSRTMRNIQRRALDAMGPMEISEAGDGMEALTVISATPGGFNVILVDWNMPNMDGITLVRRIRERDKATPLIMATTEAEKSRVMEALKAGVNNYLVKPFTADVLVEKVRQTLAKKAAA